MEISKKEKLRIGILLDGFSAPAWAYSMIEKINKSNYAEIVVIVKKKGTQQQNESFLTRISKNFRHLSYIAYRKLEDKTFKPSPFAFTKKDLDTLLAQIPVLEVSPVEKKFSDIIEQTDLEKIRPYNIDVFIRFGFRILRGDILKLAKYGIWSYHHGDNRVNRGGPAGVWESIEGWNETGCILQVLTENLDGGEVLYRSWSQKEIISINRSINNFYWKAVSFIPRKLEELYEIGGDEFKKRIKEQNETISFYSNRLYTTPKNSEFIGRILKQYFKWLKLKIWFWFNFEQWILLYCFNNNGLPATSIFRYKRIVPPKDRFWADPCVVHNNGKYFIFLEELIYKQNNGRAHIAVMEMDEKGNYKDPTVILKRDYHLSYPFVFEYKQTWYMIPETMDNKTIELYKCRSFPNEWEFVMNLKENIEAVDTTIFEKDGKVWMFTNVKENDGASPHDELFLFYADDLLTNEWKSHPNNPIVSDVKSARPAGALFFYNNKLYRPSQDCSRRYGYSTVINEVIELSTGNYIERPVSNILPNWSKDVAATHSFSSQKRLTVIDAMIKRRK